MGALLPFDVADGGFVYFPLLSGGRTRYCNFTSPLPAIVTSLGPASLASLGAVREIPCRRRKPPMGRVEHQALVAGIVVQIVDFLLPEAFTLNRLRMATRLPEAALAIRNGLLAQSFHKAPRTMLAAMITELSAGELAKISQGPHQPLGIIIGVEDNQVDVGRHDDIGVDAKLFGAMAEGQAVGDNLAARLGDEHGHPFDDRVRQVIDSGFGVNAVAFHK
jgi:hypothetical protein